MLKARYPLQAPHPKALSFSAGDRFLPLHSPNKEKEWWLVLSKDAQVGYIPMNYVLYLPVSMQPFNFNVLSIMSMPSAKLCCFT